MRLRNYIPPLEMQKVVMSSIGEHDEISIEVLRKEARDWYQLEHGYELPHLSERVQPVKYSTMINKEPKTKEEQLIQQLERVSPKQLLIELSEDGAEPTVKDLQIVEDIMFRQKILPGVVNVLLYFVLLRSNMKLTKGFIEKIAGHWARKGVKTVLDAMELAKSEYRDSKIWQEGTKGRKQTTRQPIRKELLPEWLSEEEESKAIPSDELEAEKRELNEMLKKYKK
jgi:replication initiation and membrane attachment protein